MQQKAGNVHIVAPAYDWESNMPYTDWYKYLRPYIMFKNLPLIIFTVATLSGCNSNTGNTDQKPGAEYSEDADTVSNFINETKESIVTALPTGKTFEKNEAKPAPEPKQVPLTIVVERLASDVAPIEMSIYSPDDNFLSPKTNAKKYRWRPKKGKAVTKINNLPYGDFAIALYQDVNDNGKIDKNMIGIPEEPYAFSNDYKPVIKAPSFNDCKFSYNSQQNTVTITLQN